MGKFTGAWLKSKLKFMKSMDCPDQSNCFKVLQFMIDQEASESEKEQFRLQIKNCMPCYKRYHLDVAIKELLQNKIPSKSVPEDLVETIKIKIKNAV